MGLQDMSLDQLENEITELAGHINAATCRWLLLVGELDRREGWLEWGCKSCAHWLSLRCGIGLTAARQQVKVARALPQLPQIRGSFSRGELSYSQVRAHAWPPRTPRRACSGWHGSATGAQLEALVRSYRGVLARELGPVNDAYRNRFVIYSHEDDGSLVLNARLPAEEGALVLAALEAATDRSRRCRRRFRGIVCAPSAIKADGLGGWRKRSLHPAPRRFRAARRQELVVHVDAATLAGDEDGACHVDAGPALHPETARRLGCDSSVVRILERDGRPLSAGPQDASRPAGPRAGPPEPRRRLPLPLLHRATIRGRPSHPALGPRRPERARELGPARRRHHRLLHEGGYTLERGSARRLVFRRPTGGRSAAVGACGATSASSGAAGSNPLRDCHSAPVRGQVRSRVRGRRDRGSGFALRRRRSARPAAIGGNHASESGGSLNFPLFADIHLPDPGRQA